MQMLRQLGFEIVDGPEVEHPFYNFDALNIPEHHPARDMQDTFWVSGGWLLRSHTTTVQARVLEQRPGPRRSRLRRSAACTGTRRWTPRILRCSTNSRGSGSKRGLTFAHLKGTLAFIARTMYGADRKIRFKPKFYPYTEPSVGHGPRLRGVRRNRQGRRGASATPAMGPVGSRCSAPAWFTPRCSSPVRLRPTNRGVGHRVRARHHPPWRPAGRAS